MDLTASTHAPLNWMPPPVEPSHTAESLPKVTLTNDTTWGTPSPIVLLSWRDLSDRWEWNLQFQVETSSETQGHTPPSQEHKLPTKPQSPASTKPVREDAGEQCGGGTSGVECQEWDGAGDRAGVGSVEGGGGWGGG